MSQELPPTLCGLTHRIRRASGAYGVVYRASSPTRISGKARRHYAVKRLLVSKNTSFCSSIRELDLVMSSQHPYVVRCFGLGVLETVFEGGKPRSKSSRYKDDDFVQIYKYYPHTLSSFPTGGSQDISLLILRLLCGIEFLHGRGIVHRDLKPSNIMFDENFRPKIGDFGQAQRVGLITSELGQTLRYRSPELLTRWPLDKYDSRASDIWALGCIAFEMTHEGKSPFAIINSGEVTEESLTKCIGEIPSYSIPIPSVRVQNEIHNLEELISGMLTIDPRLRPSSADLINCFLFKNHINFNLIQQVRTACSPFSVSLDTVVIDDTSILRNQIGKYLRKLATLLPKITTPGVCNFATLFHVMEIADRLSSSGNPKILTIDPLSIFFSCLYIMHKYLSEDHVREVLSFENYLKHLSSGGEARFLLPPPPSMPIKNWSNLEAKILESLNFIVYRITPYEYQIGLKITMDQNRLLIAYSHLPSGRYHVGDIVAAARHV